MTTAPPPSSSASASTDTPESPVARDRWRMVRFAARHQPYMVRRNYLYEMRAAFTFPLAAAVAEGAFTSIVATKYFGAGPLLVAVISAAPMFGNILALVWTQLSATRPKVRFVNWLQLGVVALVAAVALTWFFPTDPEDGKPIAAAGWTFAGLIILARVAASGIVTLRSAIWRFNYPRHLRAQIVGRLTAVYSLVLVIATVGSSILLESEPSSYALIYPAVAVLGLIGIRDYSKIRVRGEGQMLRQLRLIPAAAEENEPQGTTLSYARAARRPTGFFSQMREGLAILQKDRQFARYQWCQFIVGASFMVTMPSLVYMVSTEMTDPNRDYILSVVIVQLLPMLTAAIFVQVWAPMFDKTDIFTFRVRQALAGLCAHLTVLTGALTDQLWIVAAGAFLFGIAFGGGQLAWQLGQHAFAKAQDAATYMGVHVMLTGLRGMFAPFLGYGIYISFGRWVFLLSVMLCVIGWIGYVLMARNARTNPRKED